MQLPPVELIPSASPHSLSAVTGVGTLADVAREWHADGTTSAVNTDRNNAQRRDVQFCGGDDGTRTHDPLLANSIERTDANVDERETAGQLTLWTTANELE